MTRLKDEGKRNNAYLLTIVIGVLLAIAGLGWWSIPFIVVGLFAVFELTTWSSELINLIQSDAEAELARLTAQIAHHRAAYDLDGPVTNAHASFGHQTVPRVIQA